MFTITSTRIVGLIAVVCAAIVAPQALAASSTHSQNATWQSPIGQPANNTPGGIVPAYAATTSLSGNSVVLADDASNSGTVATFVYVPTNPGWGAAATEAKKSASKPAVAVCNGQPEYEYVYSGCEWWS